MVRRPDIPCSGGCGKLMWRSRTTAAEPMCRPCRVAQGRWFSSLGLPQCTRRLGVCDREGCARDAVARGMCGTHYAYWHRRNVSGQWAPTIAPAVRQAVYERDAGTCQICTAPVDFDADRQRDDMAPSLDHIIPKSLQVVPDHSEANLRLAHRGCNARRGARVDEPSR